MFISAVRNILVHCGNGNGVEIEGIHIFGVPMFMEDAVMWEYDRMIATIPSNTDVLITHQPPAGILSGNAGDFLLAKRLQEIKPQYHLFGHAHEQYGIRKVGETTYVNAALVDNNYEMKFKPIAISI